MTLLRKPYFDWRTPEVQRVLLRVIRGSLSVEEAARLLGQPLAEVRRSRERYRERLMADARLLDAIEDDPEPIEQLTPLQLQTRITALVGHQERIGMQVERYFNALMGLATKEAIERSLEGAAKIESAEATETPENENEKIETE